MKEEFKEILELLDIYKSNKRPVLRNVINQKVYTLSNQFYSLEDDLRKNSGGEFTLIRNEGQNG